MQLSGFRKRNNNNITITIIKRNNNNITNIYTSTFEK